MANHDLLTGKPKRADRQEKSIAETGETLLKRKAPEY
jgi:hypothetical protein